MTDTVVFYLILGALLPMAAGYLILIVTLLIARLLR